MPAISMQDLENAKVDVDHIAEVATSLGNTATDRLGHVKQTLAGAVGSIAAITDRGAWASGAAYQIKDLVTAAGIVYVCVSGHTAGATFAGDSAKWRVYQGVLEADLTDKTDPLKGARMVGNAARAVDVEQWGAVLDGVTNSSTAMTAANAFAVAHNLPLAILGPVHLVSTVTITAQIVDGMHQMFSAASSLIIDNGMPIRPDWFGSAAGNIRHAVDATPAYGGVVLLADKTYPPSYDTAVAADFDLRGGNPGVDYMVKPHVRIQGSKLPRYNDAETQLIDGTVIQGTFYVSSECHGFEADLFGLDAGANVVASYYPSLGDADGFCFLQCNKTYPAYGKDVHIGSIIALGSGAFSSGHGILLEAIDGGTVEYAESRRANHGVVIKSKNITAGKLIGRRNKSDDIYVKSDTYAQMDRVVISEAVSEGVVGNRVGEGVYVHAATASGGSVQIGLITTDDRSTGLRINADPGKILTEVLIGSLISRSHVIGYSLWGEVWKPIIGSAVINATNSAVVVNANSTRLDARIGELVVEGATFGVDCSGKITIGNMHSKGIATAALYHRTAEARIYMAGGHTEQNAPFSVVTPAFGWNQVGSGNDQFHVGLLAGKVVMSGLIAPNGSGIICTLYECCTPTKAMRFACLGYNGTTYSTVEVVVDTAGNVSASNFAAASSYLSLSGVSWPIPT